MSKRECDLCSRDKGAQRRHYHIMTHFYLFLGPSIVLYEELSPNVVCSHCYICRLFHLRIEKQNINFFWFALRCVVLTFLVSSVETDNLVET
jgi:hypothetical protein